MRAFEALVGKFFVVQPDMEWVGLKQGVRCTLQPGSYRVSDFTGRTYKLERYGEEFESPAVELFTYATLFDCMPEL